MKKLCSVLLVCLLAISFALSAMAAPDSFIYDNADVLIEAESMEQRAREIYDNTGVAVIVITMDGEDDVSETTMDAWNELMEVDGAVLGVNVDAQRFVVGVFGTMQDITDEEYRRLCNAYAEPDTYDEGVNNFLQLVSLLAEGEELPPETAQVPQGDPADQGEIDLSQYRLVVDEAGILTQEQLDLLNDHAEAICNTYPYDVVIYFAQHLHDREAQALADDFFDYNGYGVGNDRSGILLMVCPSERKYAFSTRGDGYYMFDGRRFDDLEESTVDDMKSGDWYQAAEDYLTVCEKYFQQGMPEEEKPNYLVIAAVCLIMGFLMGLIPVNGMKAKLRSVRKKQEAFEYVTEEGLELTHSEDRFITMNVTRVAIQESSGSSGGGRGTHTSSSGATHGGRSGSF